MGPVSAYIATPEYFATLLKTDKNLSPKPLMAIVMENMFGTPKSAISLYRNDHSGLGPKPAPGYQIESEKRVFFHQRNAANKYLSGVPLHKMTERFMNMLSKDLFNDKTIKRNWTDFPDLNLFFQNRIFEAAVEALCGPHLLYQTPSFTDDFWEYISCTPTLAYGLPRWMSPKSYAARDKVLRGIMKWHAFARQHEDYSNTSDDAPEWEEYWGSRYLKARQTYGQAAGLDNTALAAEDLSLIVAYVIRKLD
jgi:hypothetical protein